MNKETRGRKTNKEKGKEVKKSYGVYLYPTEKKRIEKRFKTLAKFIDHCLRENNIQH